MAPFINFHKFKDKNILVVQAHTDDADFNCGATVCRLVDNGANVIYVVCTKGEKGTLDSSIDPDELVKIRREEQKESNSILGVSETIHFDYPDGELEPTIELQEKLTELIRKYRPAMIFCFDTEWPECKIHPDHRSSAVGALRANSFSGLPTFFPEQVKNGLEAYQCPVMMLFNPYKKANVFVPVGNLFKRKFSALWAHRSQMEHLLDDNQKKLVETLIDLPVSFIMQAVTAIFTKSFIVEEFRELKSSELLQ
ncbi:MAG TPA: PIG-L family deacetylase [bacterium]|mgnify:CR=1 FL=1|nr:PIG-L family deacetylase [bacterium]